MKRVFDEKRWNQAIEEENLRKKLQKRKERAEKRKLKEGS